MAVATDEQLHPGIVLLNVQPSSFEQDSYPVEVGYSNCNLKSRSLLLKPAPDWHAPEGLVAALQGHGIPREETEASGWDPTDAAIELNQAFEGKRVFSARCDWDDFWLRRLHRAAGVDPTYDLGDWHMLLQQLPRDGAYDPTDIDGLRTEVSEFVPTGFRAAPASQFLATVWLCASDPALLPLMRQRIPPVAGFVRGAPEETAAGAPDGSGDRFPEDRTGVAA